MSNIVDRLANAGPELAVKAPVRLASTVNLTLSGLPVVDGVALARKDRVLVHSQSDARQNGIYIATQDAWSRARDFDRAYDFLVGTQVRVNEGASQSGASFVVTSAPDPNTSGRLGAVEITFAPVTSVDLSAIGAVLREKLSNDRTYYVRTDGSDSNTGLADSAGGAFLTPQKAWNVVAQNLDLAGFTVTVQINNGTYAEGVAATSPVVGLGSVVFSGNLGTPANVIISTTSTHCFSATYEARFRVKGMELRTTTSGNCLQSSFGGHIDFDTLRFGTCAGNHCDAFLNGSIWGDGDYSIVGNAGSHMHAYQHGTISLFVVTATLTGTPAFSNYFVGVAAGFAGFAGVTWSGSATGQRFLVHKNGAIETNGGGLTFLPGNSAGVIDSDGVYDGLRGDLQMQAGGAIIWAGGVALTNSLNLLALTGGGLVLPATGLQIGSGLVREPLVANRTYYVRTDGNDSNTGLVDNAGGAWLTTQKAWKLSSRDSTLMVSQSPSKFAMAPTRAGSSPARQWSAPASSSSRVTRERLPTCCLARRALTASRLLAGRGSALKI